MTALFHGYSPAAASPVLPGRPRVAPSQPRLLPDLEPPYHVILHDDDEHTFEYVIEMMNALFGYELQKGFQIVRTVNEQGRAIVVTCHKELAELRVEQIHEYGPDPQAKESKGSMKASMEPAE